eukprot:g40639.t1
MVVHVWIKLPEEVLEAGHGSTPLLDIDKVEKDRADFLLAFLNAVGLQTPVIVSPSMSGHFSIPFLMFHAQRLKGFVPIAPTGTNLYNADQYQKIQKGNQHCTQFSKSGFTNVLLQPLAELTIVILFQFLFGIQLVTPHLP